MTSLDVAFWVVLLLWCLAVGGTVGAVVIRFLRRRALRKANAERSAKILRDFDHSRYAPRSRYL